MNANSSGRTYFRKRILARDTSSQLSSVAIQQLITVPQGTHSPGLIRRRAMGKISQDQTVFSPKERALAPTTDKKSNYEYEK